MANWDTALLKDILFSELKVLELYLETFNTFNHTQFFGANPSVTTSMTRCPAKLSARCFKAFILGKYAELG